MFSQVTIRSPCIWGCATLPYLLLWYMVEMIRIKIIFTELPRTGGTGISGQMRGMATIPQGYQELLVVRDKVGRSPGELGVSKSMEYKIFPSVL